MTDTTGTEPYPDQGGGVMDFVGEMWEQATDQVDATDASATDDGWPSADVYGAADTTTSPDQYGVVADDPWTGDANAGQDESVLGSFGLGDMFGDSSSDEVTEDQLHPGHPQWATVTAKLSRMAERNLNVMIERMQAGAEAFRDDADTMITTYIKEPPKDLSAFGAVADALMTGIGVFFPAGKLAADLFEAAKMVFDEVKIAKAVWDEATGMEVARSVEGAREQLKDLTKRFAEDFTRRSITGYENALGTLETKVEEYLTQHPQPVPTDDSAYAALCVEMDLGPTPDSAVDRFATEIMKPFRNAVLTQTASLHFFKELDNDYARLMFLIGEEIKGNPVEPLLELIGADVPYWKRFLDIYRAEGADDAIAALQRRLTGLD